MKILLLNGSPKKNGTVATLAKAVAEGATKDGCEVELINLYELAMKPCIACMKCRPDNRCILPADDAHRVGEKIRNADGLIVCTPTHWGNMSSQLKCLFDRNVPVFMGEKQNGLPLPRHKGKEAVIITACSTPWPFNVLLPESRGAINAVKEVLGYGGYKVTGKIVKAGTKTNPKISDKELARANKIGRQLSL
jgi:multimeric flavodoxin WrbA